MTYDEAKSEYTLSSGRTFYACFSTLGLSEEVDDGYWGSMISYGSDGGQSVADWTSAEREEVANEMIRRWTIFKEQPPR